MTPRQIERLVAQTGGQLCGRITRLQDGSLLTLEPDSRRTGMPALALSLALGIAPAAVAQTGALTTAASFSLKGTVRDIQGAVIVGSKVVLVRGEVPVADTATDSAGQFAVMVPTGEYQLRVTAAGFSHFSGLISANLDSSAFADVTLKPAEVQTTVTVVSSPSGLDSTTGGVLAVSYGPWYRRLWFHARHPVLYVKHIF